MLKNLLKALVILLAFLVQMELALRLLGLSLTWLRAENGSSIAAKTREKTIVTLGESTTTDMTMVTPSWPRLLEKKLRESGESVQIRNLAIPGTTTPILIKDFFEEFENDPPDLVITMMGINDTPRFWLAKEGLVSTGSFWRDLRTVKLFRLLRALFLSKQSKEFVYFSPLDFPRMPELIAKIKSGDPTSERLIEDFLASKTPIEKAQFYAFLSGEIRPSFDRPREEFKKAIEFEKKSLEFSFSVGGVLDMFSIYAAWDRTGNECRWLAEKLLQSQQKISDVVVVQLANCLNPQEETTRRFLARYLDPRYQVKDFSAGSPTAHSYKQLHDFLQSKGICQVAMQYPLRPLAELRSYLPDLSERVFFVENIQNFQQALSQYSDAEIFVDHFGGTFGHTTVLGNQILADSVYPIVKKALVSHSCRGDFSQGH